MRLILAGGPDARQRGRRRRAGRAVGRRRVERGREGAGPQGRRSRSSASSSGPGPPRRVPYLRLVTCPTTGPTSSDVDRVGHPARYGRAVGQRAVRRVRRSLRARDARAGVRGARGSRSARRGSTRRSGASWTASCATTPAGPSISPSASHLSDQLGVRLLLKREDLNHTGSHKINNVLGQALLAKRMGKTRLVAETGAGQHGVATATAAALIGPRVQGVHGRGRRRAPGPQRVPDAPARRRGGGGPERQPHAQGRRQRGAARLGRHRREHALLPRLGDGAAPVPVDGPRVPPRDRRRGS